MIRVLHTESSMNLGGQELRILMEMEGLRDYGYESVLAARPGSRILEEAAGRGLVSYEVGMRGSIDPVAVMRLARIMRRERIDLVNAHGSKDGWSAGLAARLTGRRVIRSRHVANPIRPHFFGRLVYGPLCDVVMTTSESIRAGMASRGVDPSRIVSVPTGIDLETFRPDLPRGSFRKELGVGGDTRLVGFVSVVRGDKGPDIFVDAALKVVQDRQDVDFVVAGDGWMLDRIREKVASSAHPGRIHVVGYRRDVPAVMTDLDLFVLPVRIPEGVPQAVLQAHATKTPVIASDMGGVNEVAIHDRTALLVKPGDADALTDAIIRMLDDREYAARLAEAGYNLVRERYTREAMLKSMDGLYRGLLKS